MLFRTFRYFLVLLALLDPFRHLSVLSSSFKYYYFAVFFGTFATFWYFSVLPSTCKFIKYTWIRFFPFVSSTSQYRKSTKKYGKVRRSMEKVRKYKIRFSPLQFQLLEKYPGRIFASVHSIRHNR